MQRLYVNRRVRCIRFTSKRLTGPLQQLRSGSDVHRTAAPTPTASDFTGSIIPISGSDSTTTSHPQLGERLDDIYEEAVDFVPRILETCGIDPQINRDTLRLIEVVVHIGYVVAIHFKQGFKRARPHQFDQRIYPSIPVPAHYSFPSGHSTQAHLVTNVLKDLFDTINLHTMVPHLCQIAKDVAENREWAGVHYDSDSEAGKCIAQELKEILLDRGNKTGVKELFEKAKKEWMDEPLLDTPGT